MLDIFLPNLIMAVQSYSKMHDLALVSLDTDETGNVLMHLYNIFKTTNHHKTNYLSCVSFNKKVIIIFFIISNSLNMNIVQIEK